MRCPFCGAESEGKFCTNCGTRIPQEQPPVQQPVQPVQPVQQPPMQDYVPITPSAEPSMAEEYIPIQPSYAMPITQPVQNRVKSNGWCSAGLILSIAGWFCMGLLSPFGFIFSFIGLISASRKHQPGKGKAIAGLILSGIIIVSLGSILAFSWGDLKRAYEYGNIESPLDVINIIDNAVDREDSSYKKQVKKITGEQWIASANGSDELIVFENKKVKICDSYENTNDYYGSGKYRIYVGNDAYIQMTDIYSKKLHGMTKLELNDIIKANKNMTRDNLVFIVIEDIVYRKNGKESPLDKTERYEFGYYTDDPIPQLFLTDGTNRFFYVRKNDKETAKSLPIRKIVLPREDF